MSSQYSVKSIKDHFDIMICICMLCDASELSKCRGQSYYLNLTCLSRGILTKTIRPNKRGAEQDDKQGIKKMHFNYLKFKLLAYNNLNVYLW